MCNLYDIGTGAGHETETLQGMIVEALAQLEKSMGIRKTDTGVVALKVDGELVGQTMRWGFDRHVNPCINNARSEKLGGQMWNKSWREKRRCLIPIETFYEWSGPKGQKQTHAFQSDDRQLLWAGGLWEESPKLGFCYTMLTRAATGVIEPIHERMPAILDPPAAEEFLDADDPLDIIAAEGPNMRTFPCLNPLKTNRFAEPAEVQTDLF
ncbi:MAG: SOS response-associated peptidase family protein [Verrucomicrobiota bacterium]